MVGYWTKYWSTILKGPFTLSWKQRWEAKREIISLRNADKLIYGKLIGEIEKEHRVGKGMKDEEKAVHSLKRAAENGGLLAINSSFEDELIMRTIFHIITSLQHASDIIKKGPKSKGKITSGSEKKLEEISKIMAISMIEGIKRSEQFYRKEYREVMMLMDEAVKEQDIFTARLRRMFKTTSMQTIFARWAVRIHIRKERIDLKKLNEISLQFSLLVKELEDISRGKKAKDNVDEIILKFRNFVEEEKKIINDVFYKAYLVKRRDFFIMLAILTNADTLERLNVKWVAAYLMPRNVLDKIGYELKDVKKKTEDELKIIAQGFRIVIAQQERALAAAKRSS